MILLLLTTLSNSDYRGSVSGLQERRGPKEKEEKTVLKGHWGNHHCFLYVTLIQLLSNEESQRKLCGTSFRYQVGKGVGKLGL